MARLPENPVSPRSLALLEHIDRYEHSDEEPLEPVELGAPIVKLAGIDEHIIGEHVVPGACDRQHGGAHPRRKSLTSRAGNDARVVGPNEALLCATPRSIHRSSTAF